MVIVENQISLVALEYKKIADLEDPKSRVRKNQIVKQIRNQYIGVLRNKQRGVPLSEHNIIESWFNESIMYALVKWKGKTQFGVYLSVCFKSIISNYLKELSPVNRKDVKGRVSYDQIIDTMLNYEDSLDYDEVGFLSEDDELRMVGDMLNDVGGMDYSEIDAQFEAWKNE